MVKRGLQVWLGISGPFLLLWVCGLRVEAQKKDNARVMGLVELYGISASIVYGEEDAFAANLLLDALIQVVGI